MWEKVWSASPQSQVGVDRIPQLSRSSYSVQSDPRFRRRLNPGGLSLMQGEGNFPSRHVETIYLSTHQRH